MAIAIVVGTSLTAIATNGYRTDLLERMAKVMKISARLDTLSNGEYYRHLIYNNRAITIIVNQGKISHIGYSVFTPELRRAIPYPVCDFLERYALEISLPLERERSVARQLEDDGILFRGGSFDFFKRLESDTTYNVYVENINGKRYSVIWQKDGKESFSVNFPIEYDLIVGTDMIENERRILEDVKACNSDTKKEKGINDSMRLKLSWQGKYYTLPGDKFYVKQLNSNLYYEKERGKGYRLFYHPSFLVESLTNLMTTGAIDNSYDLQIRLVKYGFVQDTVVVKLNQWINYCLEQGCSGYFGINSVEKNIADCELIMCNPALGYLHLMRMSVDITTVEERKGLIKARLNSFVNTTRVKYLFDELKM